MQIATEKGKTLKLTLADGSIQMLRGIKDWAISKRVVTYRRLNEEMGAVKKVARVVHRIKPGRKLLAVKHPKLTKVYLFDSVQAFLNTHKAKKWPKAPIKHYIYSNIKGMHVETEWVFFYVNIDEL